MWGGLIGGLAAEGGEYGGDCGAPRATAPTRSDEGASRGGEVGQSHLLDPAAGRAVELGPDRRPAGGQIRDLVGHHGVQAFAGRLGLGELTTGLRQPRRRVEPAVGGAEEAVDRLRVGLGPRRQ